MNSRIFTPWVLRPRCNLESEKWKKWWWWWKKNHLSLPCFFEGTEIEFRCRFFCGWLMVRTWVEILCFHGVKKATSINVEALKYCSVISAPSFTVWNPSLQSCSLPYCYPGWKSLNIQKSNRIQTGGLIWYIIPNRNGCESLMWKRVFSSYQRVSLQSAGNVSALA